VPEKGASVSGACPGCGDPECPLFGDECWYANGCPELLDPDDLEPDDLNDSNEWESTP
jgi:hypothetical protein